MTQLMDAFANEMTQILDAVRAEQRRQKIMMAHKIFHANTKLSSLSTKFLG